MAGIDDNIEKFANAQRILIVACGTSWHAGLVAEYIFEEFARIPVEVEYASEFRYRNPIINDKDVLIAISQSGETADTLAAIKLAKEKGAAILAKLNAGETLKELEWTSPVTVSRKDAQGFTDPVMNQVYKLNTSKLPAFGGFVDANRAYVFLQISGVSDALAEDKQAKASTSPPIASGTPRLRTCNPLRSGFRSSTGSCPHRPRETVNSRPSTTECSCPTPPVLRPRIFWRRLSPTI